MANINQFSDEYDENDNDCLSLDAADRYATTVAKEALESYIKQAGNVTTQPSKGSIMDTTGINEAAQDVLSETKTSAALISGEVLLENIETIADRLVLSRMAWWKKILATKKDKELAVTVATYAIVHAIKTGGFGLTKYRINHMALDYVTLAANQRILKYIVKSMGVDFNIAKMLFSAPTITAGE